MKFLRFVRVFSVFVFAVLATMPVAQGQLHFAEAVPYSSGGIYANSVAVADLNGDGKLDLVVGNGCQTPNQTGGCPGQLGEVSVLLGNGDGTFQPAISYSSGGYQAFSLAVGDVNGDGHPDVVVTNQCQTLACNNGGVSVLLGNGDGTFQAALTYSSGGDQPTSIAIGDLRGDGKVDLVVTNFGVAFGNIFSVGVLLGNGDGTFQPVVIYDSGGYNPISVAIADVNGDGHPDVVAANWCGDGNCGEDGTMSVLLGNGDGKFEPAVAYDSGGRLPESVAVADLRGNGILDLVVANVVSVGGDSGSDVVGVLLGNGDGSFQPAVSYSAGGNGNDALAVGDVNGDGIPDLVVVEECRSPISGRGRCFGGGRLALLLGNGDGTFQQAIGHGSGGFGGTSVAIRDVNGDGRPDLLVTNSEATKGDGNHSAVAAVLNKTSYSTQTTLTSSSNPSRVGQSITFTATIASTPPVPNGELITFYNGETNLGTGTTTNGVASLSTSFFKAKTYTIKASYPRDAFHKKSSGTVKQVVNP